MITNWILDESRRPAAAQASKSWIKRQETGKESDGSMNISIDKYIYIYKSIDTIYI